MIETPGAAVWRKDAGRVCMALPAVEAKVEVEVKGRGGVRAEVD